MPKQGFKSITVPDEVYVKLQDVAGKNSRTPAKQIEYFLKTCRKEA
jgi:predicted CopG family antitoxin